jgi:hypothetical protein
MSWDAWRMDPELYQENLKWAELDEEAEAEWKFFRQAGGRVICRRVGRGGAGW